MNKLTTALCIASCLLSIQGCVNNQNAKISYVDYAGDNLAIEFTQGDERYLNINGEISGPYESITIDGYPVGLSYISESTIAIREQKNNKQYIKINEKEYGPYEDLLNVEVKGNQWGFIFLKENNYYYNINEEIFGPYDLYPNEIHFSDNKYAFTYRKNNKDFVKTKNKTFGPFDYVGINYLDDNNLAFVYDQNDKWFTNLNGIVTDEESNIKIAGNNLMEYKFIEHANTITINGKTYGPFEHIYDYDVSKNMWAFAYVDDNKSYLQTNTEKLGPFDVEEYEGSLYGKINFTLGDTLMAINTPANDGKTSIKINGKEQGPHKTIFIVSFKGDNWYYNFEKNGEHFINLNGNIQKIKSTSVHPEFNGSNWAYIDEDENMKQIVIINGEKFGPYDESTRFIMLNSNWLLISDENGVINVDYKEYPQK